MLVAGEEQHLDKVSTGAGETTATDVFGRPPSVDRILWVDYARGLGIVLVVLGHVLYGMRHASLALPPHSDYLLDWIYSFHMPLFFFLSGMFVPVSIRKGITRFVRRRIGTILYCYLLWYVLNVAARVVFGGVTNYQSSWSDLLHVLDRPFGELWFLYVLVICCVGFTILHGLGIRTKGVLLAGAALLFLRAFVDADQSRILDLALYHSVFFALGAAATDLRFAPCRNLYVWAALGVTCFALLSSAVAAPEWCRHFRAAVALFGIAGTALFGQVLAEGKSLRFIATLGALSLQIYLAHTFFAAGWRIACQKVMGVEGVTVHVVGGLLAGLLLPVVLYAFSVRLHFPYLFGLSKPPCVAYPRRDCDD